MIGRDGQKKGGKNEMKRGTKGWRTKRKKESREEIRKALCSFPEGIPSDNGERHCRHELQVIVEKR